MSNSSTDAACIIPSSHSMLLTFAALSGCTPTSTNPVCVAMQKTLTNPDPTKQNLSGFADNLTAIQASDYQTYFKTAAGQQQGQKVSQGVLAGLKCLLTPTDQMAVAERDAMKRIKNWYSDNLLSYYAQAGFAGGLTNKDVLLIQSNLNKILCTGKREETDKLLIGIIGVVVGLLLAVILNHARSK